MKKNPFESEPGCSKELMEGVGVGDPHQLLMMREPGESSSDPVSLERDATLGALDEFEAKIITTLEELTARTGMPITQENGQRRYGPPLDTYVSSPPRGSEVFVGKIPRDCFEPELVPIFEKAGRIFELRLMMDFSGTNRGYCFVHYFTPGEADQAVRELNNYQIRSGHRIGVVKSVDNCRLFISGIPKSKTRGEILEEVRKLIEGVVNIIVYPSQKKYEFNRGFAFVEFENHKLAAMARRRLVIGNLQMWGIDIAVDWAEPEPEVEVLHVRNLNLQTTEQVIKDAFDKVSNRGVVKVKKVQDFAFIYFETHTQAETAKLAMENSSIEGSKIQVNFAKSAVQNCGFQQKGSKVRIEFNFDKSGGSSKPSFFANSGNKFHATMAAVNSKLQEKNFAGEFHFQSQTPYQQVRNNYMWNYNQRQAYGVPQLPHWLEGFINPFSFSQPPPQGFQNSLDRPSLMPHPCMKPTMVKSGYECYYDVYSQTTYFQSMNYSHNGQNGSASYWQKHRSTEETISYNFSNLCYA